MLASIYFLCKLFCFESSCCRICILQRGQLEARVAVSPPPEALQIARLCIALKRCSLRPLGFCRLPCWIHVQQSHLGCFARARASPLSPETDSVLNLILSDFLLSRPKYLFPISRRLSLVNQPFVQRKHIQCHWKSALKSTMSRGAPIFARAKSNMHPTCAYFELQSCLTCR